MASGAVGPDGDLDALRRRVYGPGATDEDRDRYRELLADRPATAGLAPSSDAPPDEAPPPASRVRGLLLAGALAVLALVGVGIGLVPRGSGEPPSRSPEPVAVDAATRSELVQNLSAGGTAGIAAYLVVNRPPEALRTATRLYTIERNGTGPQAFSLSGTPAETGSGRVTVLLVTAAPGRAGWTAYRARPQGDDPSPLQAIERRGGDQQAGSLTAATFSYRAGGRPVRLEVDVPKGVHWGAAVVFSD